MIRKLWKRKKAITLLTLSAAFLGMALRWSWPGVNVGNQASRLIRRSMELQRNSAKATGNQADMKMPLRPYSDGVDNIVNRQLKNELSSNDDIEKRFQVRREILQRACSLYRNSSLFRLEPTSFYPFPLYKPVLNASIYYCPITKVACTTWAEYLYAVKKHMNSTGVKASSNVSQADEKIYFAFVREPYARLLSAYVDKLMTPNVVFWGITGTHIVRHFRPGYFRKQGVCGHDVTFPEFVKYIIHSQKTGEHRNGHFIPIHDQCEMCHFPFQYIGHLETIKEDMPYIIRKMGSPVQYAKMYDRDTIAQNARMVFMKDRRKRVQGCMDFDEAGRRLWKKYQIRGLINKALPFPYSRERAINITFEEFIAAAVNAYEQSKNYADTKAQRAEAVREAYAQISLQDRLQLQQTLFLDFEMFGFYPFLKEVFPRKPYMPDETFSYFKL